MSAESYEDNLVEIYRCSNELEADRAIVEILEPAGIECYRRDRVSHALPAPSSDGGGYFIAVSSTEAVRARDLLDEALGDEVLDGQEGELVDR